MSNDSSASADGVRIPSRRYVYYAIGVVFLVSVLNVVDRYILSVLAPEIQQDLGVSDTELGLLLGPSFSVVHFLELPPGAVVRASGDVDLHPTLKLDQRGSGAGPELAVRLVAAGVRRLARRAR